MKVLVTGGTGRVGAATVQDLVDHGYEVVSVDQRRPESLPKGVRFIQTNLGNVGEVAGAMAGCEAVIHMGAIPAPYSFADEHVFNNNVQSTFAVFQAASLLGVRKVAFASSISALGTSWAPVPFPPDFAPIDESHPFIIKDCYGLSKEVDEQTGKMFNRRDGMQVVALRFHWVTYMEEAKAKAAQISADPYTDNWWRLLWGYVDVRDAADICRRAIEVDGLGFEAFIVTAADTLSSTPTEELLRTVTPTVEIRKPIPGCGSGFDISKAKTLLGWEPKYSWRND